MRYDQVGFKVLLVCCAAPLLCGVALADPHTDSPGLGNKGTQPARSVQAERALARGAGSLEAHLEAARAYLAESIDTPSKRAKARKHIGTVLKRQPNNAEALLIAGQIEMLSADWKQAARYFRRATVMAPNNPAAHLALGDALSRLGDEEGAAAAFAAFRAASGMQPIEQ